MSQRTRLHFRGVSQMAKHARPRKELRGLLPRIAASPTTLRWAERNSEGECSTGKNTEIKSAGPPAQWLLSVNFDMRAPSGSFEFQESLLDRQSAAITCESSVGCNH